MSTVEPLGDTTRITLADPLRLGVDITPGATTALQLRPGSAIWASVKATEIEVTPAGTGSTVRYEATLELKGILQFADPILGLVFNGIGDKAAAGMAKALESAKVR